MVALSASIFVCTTLNFSAIIERVDIQTSFAENEKESSTPFGFGKGEGFDKGADESEWIVGRERYKADEEFADLSPIDGKISGRIAKEYMLKSKLPNSVSLRRHCKLQSPF